MNTVVAKTESSKFPDFLVGVGIHHPEGSVVTVREPRGDVKENPLLLFAPNGENGQFTVSIKPVCQTAQSVAIINGIIKEVEGRNAVQPVEKQVRIVSISRGGEEEPAPEIVLRSSSLEQITVAVARATNDDGKNLVSPSGDYTELTSALRTSLVQAGQFPVIEGKLKK